MFANIAGHWLPVCSLYCLPVNSEVCRSRSRWLCSSWSLLEDSARGAVEWSQWLSFVIKWSIQYFSLAMCEIPAFWRQQCVIIAAIHRESAVWNPTTYFIDHVCLQSSCHVHFMFEEYKWQGYRHSSATNCTWTWPRVGVVLNIPCSACGARCELK